MCTTWYVGADADPERAANIGAVRPRATSGALRREATRGLLATVDEGLADEARHEVAGVVMEFEEPGDNRPPVVM